MKRSIIALFPLTFLKVALLPMVVGGSILYSCTKQSELYAGDPSVTAEATEVDIVLNEDNAVFYQDCPDASEGIANNSECKIEQEEKPEEFAQFHMIQPFPNLKE